MRQELFFFHSTVSPGSAFFLPRGQVIYNTLMAYMREEYWKRGYQEVTTPNMFNSALWKQSGHWQHYKDDMFRFEVEKDEWAMKPMNCPGHCVLFGHRERKSSLLLLITYHIHYTTGYTFTIFSILCHLHVPYRYIPRVAITYL